MDEIRDDQDALATRLAPLRGLVAFDGCDGVGKTQLARDMARRLDGDAIDADDYVEPHLGYFVKALRLERLRASLRDALARSPVVLFSSICARDVVGRLGLPAALYVYVEQRATMDAPANPEILGAEDGSPDALAGRWALSPLDREIFDYHAAFKPRRNADIVYVRIAD
jgi:hypothetical protein